MCVCSDRYVIYGNHRDSWVHGAIDPSSGTAVMLEITRILGQMVKMGEFTPTKCITAKTRCVVASK